MAFFGLFGKKSKEEKASLDQGLQKTKTGIFEKISRAIVGKSTVDDDVLDGIEEALIASDIGVDTTLKIIESLQERVERDKFMNTEELNSILSTFLCFMVYKFLLFKTIKRSIQLALA